MAWMYRPRPQQGPLVAASCGTLHCFVDALGGVQRRHTVQIQRAVPMDGTSLSNRRGQWRLVERTIPHHCGLAEVWPDPHAVKPLGVGRCQAFAWHRLLTAWRPARPMKSANCSLTQRPALEPQLQARQRDRRSARPQFLWMSVLAQAASDPKRTYRGVAFGYSNLVRGR